jgi:hypothetical protein
MSDAQGRRRFENLRPSARGKFAMARQPNAHDVSVDEIIASIRRIVADDDQGNTNTAADSVPAASPPAGNAAELRTRSATAMEDILNFPPVNRASLVRASSLDSRTSPQARTHTGNDQSKWSRSRNLVCRA